MPEKKLRILIAGINWPPETFIERLIKGLIEYDVHVTIATSRSPVTVLANSMNLSWLHAPDWDGNMVLRLSSLIWLFLKAFWSSPRKTFLLMGRVRREKWNVRLRDLNRLLPFAVGNWDVIYFPWNSAAIACEPVFDLGVPVMVSCRGSQVNIAPHNPERQDLVKGLHSTLFKAAAVHCVSESVKEEAEKYGLKKEKAHVIRPAVDPEFFSPKPDVEEKSNHVLHLVTTGTLIWMKGLEYALLAVFELKTSNISVCLEIIGDGPERQRLLYTINDLGLEKEVNLLGKLTPEEVRDRLNKADAYLLTSVSEGISNSVLEAMACGLPVVTTDCGGMSEAVTDRVEGFVVPVRDPEAIAKALYVLYDAPALRKRMGQAGRERIVREFALSKQINSFITLFRTVSL